LPRQSVATAGLANRACVRELDLANPLFVRKRRSSIWTLMKNTSTGSRGAVRLWSATHPVKNRYYSHPCENRATGFRSKNGESWWIARFGQDQ
jgi:hypothetical protein